MKYWATSELLSYGGASHVRVKELVVMFEGRRLLGENGAPRKINKLKITNKKSSFLVLLKQKLL